MSEALYERYKDALRRGHVAALRGRHAAALEAYGEAAGIAPDRSLPLVSIGTVLHRLGKPAEALAAFDAALDRAPDDEAATRGRAEVLAGTGDRSGAAQAFDRVAALLDAAGRLPDAADAARRALELAESRSRRATMRDFVKRLDAASGDPAAAEALARASSVLEGRAPTGDTVGAPPDAPPDAPRTVAPTDDEPVAVGSSGGPAPAPPPPPPFDPGQAIAAVELAGEGDDPALARTLALAASAGHRAAGQPITAIDACYMALAGSPADPGLHLALAEIYLDQGWRALAIDKLILLRRLADLAEDTDTQARICAISAARLPDEPRLVSRCA